MPASPLPGVAHLAAQGPDRPARGTAPLADGNVTAERLADLPLILTARPKSLVDQVARAHGVRPNVVIETNTRLVVPLVCRGMGYTVLSRAALDGEFAGTGVSAARIAGFQVGWVLASPRAQALSPAAVALHNLLAEIAGPRPASSVSQAPEGSGQAGASSG